MMPSGGGGGRRNVQFEDQSLMQQNRKNSVSELISFEGKELVKR